MEKKTMTHSRMLSTLMPVSRETCALNSDSGMVRDTLSVNDRLDPHRTVISICPVCVREEEEEEEETGEEGDGQKQQQQQQKERTSDGGEKNQKKKKGNKKNPQKQ